MCFGVEVFCALRGCREVQINPGGRCDVENPLVSTHIIHGYRRSIPVCAACYYNQREEARRADADFNRDTERAKALLEYFRGERESPYLESELQVRHIEQRRHFQELYSAGARLHPFAHDDQFLSTWRTDFENMAAQNTLDPMYTCVPALFEECLGRQREIDDTGRPLTEDDRGYLFSSIVERTTPHHLNLLENRSLTSDDTDDIDDIIDTLMDFSDFDIEEEDFQLEFEHELDIIGSVATQWSRGAGSIEPQGLSFRQFLARRHVQAVGDTVTPEQQLENDLDDYEHNYLGRGGGTAIELLDFRSLRREVAAISQDSTGSISSHAEANRRQFYGLSRHPADVNQLRTSLDGVHILLERLNNVATFNISSSCGEGLEAIIGFLESSIEDEHEPTQEEWNSIRQLTVAAGLFIEQQDRNLLSSMEMMEELIYDQVVSEIDQTANNWEADFLYSRAEHQAENADRDEDESQDGSQGRFNYLECIDRDTLQGSQYSEDSDDEFSPAPQLAPYDPETFASYWEGVDWFDIQNDST